MSAIPLTDIVVNAGTQIRAAINEQTVAAYAERMTAGDQFPPVILFHDGNRHYLADGFHRVLAATRIQLAEIPADVRPGTKTDALWFALGANKANGHQMTEADKTHAVELAIKHWPEMLDREIADQIGCSKSLVSKVALRIAKNTGVPAEIRGRALQIQAKRERVRELVGEGHGVVEIAKMAKVSPSTVTGVRAEMGLRGPDKSKAAVAERRDRIRELASEGYTSRQIAVAVGLDERTIASTVKAEGIEVPADRAVGKTKRHDSNRIVSQIVADAENITEGVDLVNFADLDRAQFADWLRSLQSSRDKLGAFIRRLMKEQQHGEAA